MRFLFLMFATFVFGGFASATPESPRVPILPDNRDFSETLSALLILPEGDIDLRYSKLAIDNLIDPTISIERQSVAISEIARQATLISGAEATDRAKVAALRSVVYEAGDWNSHRPFSYDFDNPNGRLARNKTISEYLSTRRGNCVNMPILFLLVGEEMGLELNITTAPRHVFVQFYDRQSDQLIHLEPTSGALPQRIAWQRKVLPMTDRAVESGMYMKRLSRREQVSAMAETLLQALREQNNFAEMLEVTELMFEAYPQNDIALLNAADASLRLIQSEILPHYQSPEEMPPEVRADFEKWAYIHDQSLAELDRLGWQPAQDTPETYIPD